MSEEINDLIEHIAKCELYDTITVECLKDRIANLQKQLQQKENIIKEVREYIESNYFYTSQGMKKANETIFGIKLLEILDKGE